MVDVSALSSVWLNIESSLNGLEDSCGWVIQWWWAVNGEGELCKWKPGCWSSVGKSGGHLNIQPQGQRSNSIPLNMPHKEKGSDKMARSAQARICILMCLSESLWIRAGSMRPHNPAGRRKTTYNSRCSENNILSEKKLLQYRKAGHQWC